MPKRYDVVVIGAGPAGMMAAKILAQHGCAVALLERKQSMAGVRRADGGAIGVNEPLYDRMVRFDAQRREFSFPDDGFSIPYDGPYANIYGFQVHSPGKKRIMFGDWEQARRRGDEARVGVFISKQALLQRLVDDCRASGVELFPGLNLTDIRKTRESVLLNCSGQMFEGSYVIAADGVNSRAVRLLGLNSARTFRGTYRYLTWMLKGAVPIDTGSFNFIMTNKGSYAIYDTWEPGIYHVSVFSSDPAADLEEGLRELIYRDKNYSPWFAGCARTEVINCVSSILSPIEVPLKDNVLIIGDAAWTLEFSNMGALCNGWKAGSALAQALKDRAHAADALKDYLAWWKESFYEPFGRYDFGPMGGGGTIMQSYLTDEELDYLAGLMEKPFPATMNFFTLFNTLGSAYAEVFPRVYDERPEIMDKLFSLRSRFDEIGERIRRAGFPNL